MEANNVDHVEPENNAAFFCCLGRLFSFYHYCRTHENVSFITGSKQAEILGGHINSYYADSYQTHVVFQRFTPGKTSPRPTVLMKLDIFPINLYLLFAKTVKN